MEEKIDFFGAIRTLQLLREKMLRDIEHLENVISFLKADNILKGVKLEKPELLLNEQEDKRSVATEADSGTDDGKQNRIKELETELKDCNEKLMPDSRDEL